MNTIPSLTKDDAATLTGKIRVGAAWDTSSRGKGGLIGKLSRHVGADLDLVAVLFQDGVPVRMAGIGNDNPLKDGSVLHSGDNQTGKGEGDDEYIDFDVNRIDQDVDKIVVMVSAFKKVNKDLGDRGFSGADNVDFTVYSMDTGRPEKEFRIMPALGGRENCCIVAVLTRGAAGWEMRKKNVMVMVEHGNTDRLLRAAINVDR